MKTKSAPQERKESKRLFLPVFISVILIMSVFGVVLGSYSDNDTKTNQGGIDVNGKTFVQDPNGRWRVDVGGINVQIQFGPDELKEIDVKTGPEVFQSAQKIYLSRAPDTALLNAEFDLIGNIKPFIPVVPACYKDGSGCENLPLKDCQDAQNGIVVVKLGQAGMDSVEVNGACITLRGSSLFLNKAVDKIILGYFGVII